MTPRYIHYLCLNPRLDPVRPTIHCALLPRGGALPGDRKTTQVKRVTCPLCLKLLKRPLPEPAQAEPVPCRDCDGDGTITSPLRDETCDRCGGSGIETVPAQAEPPLTTQLPVPTVIALAVKRIFQEPIIICPMPSAPHIRWVKRASDGVVLASAWIDPEDGKPEIKLIEWQKIH